MSSHKRRRRRERPNVGASDGLCCFGVAISAGTDAEAKEAAGACAIAIAVVVAVVVTSLRRGIANRCAEHIVAAGHEAEAGKCRVIQRTHGGEHPLCRSSRIGGQVQDEEGGKPGQQTVHQPSHMSERRSHAAVEQGRPIFGAETESGEVISTQHVPAG